LYRPGGVSREQIEKMIGPVAVKSDTSAEAHASPGLHPRHYSPRTRLLLVVRGEVPREGSGAYLQLTNAPVHGVSEVVAMPLGAAEYATKLYGALHALDARDYEWIAVDAPPELPEWEAVLDRLQRAAFFEG